MTASDRHYITAWLVDICHGVVKASVQTLKRSGGGNQELLVGMKSLLIITETLCVGGFESGVSCIVMPKLLV